MNGRRDFLKALSMAGVATAGITSVDLNKADLERAIGDGRRTALIVNPARVRMDEVAKAVGDVPIIRLRQRAWWASDITIQVLKW